MIRGRYGLLIALVSVMPFVCAACATCVFFGQGGFGAGHGHCDLVIGKNHLAAIFPLWIALHSTAHRTTLT